MRIIMTTLNVKKRLLINYFTTSSNRLLTQFISFLIYPIILSKIGIEAVGIMAMLDSLSGPTSFLQQSFLPAKIKYLADYFSNKDWDNYNKIIANSFIVSVIFSLIISSILVIIAFNFSKLFNIESTSEATAFYATIITAVTILCANSLTSGEEIFMSIQRYDIINIVQFFVNNCKNLGIIAFLFYGYGLLTVLIINGLGQIVIRILLIIMACIKTNILKYKYLKIDLNIIKKLFVFSSKVLIISISVYMTRHSSKLLIGIFLPVSYVGYFYTCYRVFEMVKQMPLMMQTTLLPTAAYLKQMKDKYRMDQLVFRVTKYSYIIFLLIAIPLIFSAKTFLYIWVGPAVAKYAFVLQILLLHPIIAFSHSVLSQVVVALDDFKFAVYYSVVLSVLSVLILVSTIKFLGLTSAALSVVIPYVILFQYYLKNALLIVKISFSEFLKNTFKPLVIPVIGSIFVSVILSEYFLKPNWGSLIVYFLIIIFCFILFYFIFSINENEKKDILIIWEKISLKLGN